MNYVNIGGLKLEATIQSRPVDNSWEGRESKAITFTSTYEEAMTLFSDGVIWSCIYTNPESGAEVETDMSEFALAGSVTDNRNGTVTVKMGKYLNTELMTLSAGVIPRNYAEAIQLREEIREAIQTMYESLNNGQQKQIIKKEKVKALFDRYNIEYIE